MGRRFREPQLLMASTNQGKLKELRQMLGAFPVTLVSIADYSLETPEETEDSFAGNALLKARYYSHATGLPALADDSGLCVEGLNGAPGIYSARWAEDGFDVAIARIEKELAGNDNRRAYFACALCLAWPDGGYEQVEGQVHGTLRFPARGNGGFGYDPIFIADGYEMSFAEMGAVEKNRISHRAEALRLLVGECF